MALRMRDPLPLPAEDLRRLQQQLSPQYGSLLWEGGDRTVLVAAVPGAEPDLVNDPEGVVEHAAQSDVERAQACVLLGARAIHTVPVEPLRTLMADRVEFDRRQCEDLRVQLPGVLSHTIYRSPADPKRRLRLAVRVPAETVAGLSDDDLETLVDRLGPEIERGRLREVHCVYLVASRNHVRLDTGLFVQDLLARWRDEDRQARLEALRRAKEEEARRARQKERAAIIAAAEAKRAAVLQEAAQIRDVPRPAPPRAQLRHAGAPYDAGALDTIHYEIDTLGHRFETAAPRPMARRPHEARGPGHAPSVRTAADAPSFAPPAPRPRAAPGPAPHPPTARPRTAAAPWDAAPTVAAPPARAPAAAPTPPPDVLEVVDPLVRRVADTLEAQGFDIMVRPATGHPIDVAAERAQGDPQRVVAVACDRFRNADAEALLAAARELDVDLVLAVSEAADPEAQRRIVATRVRWLRPDELPHLRL